jgi:hypothetical protein
VSTSRQQTSDQLRAAQAGQHERHQDETIAPHKAESVPLRVLGGGEQAGELLIREPVTLHGRQP